MKGDGEQWLRNTWRPITAVVYLVICCFDFIIFPVFWSLFLHFTEVSDKAIAWDPLTLKGAGLFHLAFGAILGVSAYTRGQEKIRRMDKYEPEYDDSHRYRHRAEPEYETSRYDEEPVRTRPRFEPPRR